MFQQSHAYVVALLATGAIMAQTPTVPPLVRIIVLDTSGSMNGPRITTAKAEILAVARQLPPSKDRPIILVPFHSTPHSVGTFTDLPSFKAHLQNIKAGGGTSIASGLERALEEMKRYTKANHLCFLLYSDGEDSDQQGISAAEKKLDSLFAVRSKHGLQSLAFCKRWENANAQLLADLAKSGNVKVIDAGELKVVPVTLTPVINLVSAGWAKAKPLTLELECKARIELSGVPYDSCALTAVLRCIDPGAILKTVVLRPGDPNPTTFTMQVPLSTATAATGKATMHFVVSSTGSSALKNGMVLPQLATDHLAISVEFPPIGFDVKLAATLVSTKPSSWSDPLLGKPVQHLMLTCTATGSSNVPWPRPLNLRIKPQACRQVAGKDLITFSGPGTLSFPISLEADTPTAGTTAFSVTVLIQPEPSAGFTVVSPDIRLTQDSPLPPTVETSIAAQVRSVSEIFWSELSQGLASFTADVTFDVAGPIPPGTQLTLVCPPAVRRVEVEPATLHSGSQSVRITLQAQFAAPSTLAQFEIKVQPPIATGAVRFVVPPPIKIQATAPPPMQLALLGRGGANPQVTVYDLSAPVVLTGTPVLLRGSNHQVSGITAIVRTGPPLGSQSSRAAPLDAVLTLPLKLSVAEKSFFFDTTIEEDIDVVPNQASPALIGSRQSCTVTLDAPFKRVLFYGAAALAVITVVFLIIRLTSTPETQNDTGTEIVRE